MPRLPNSQKAFTLIEVLMAATVLVVGFTAVIQAVTVGSEMIDTARKQQIAQQIIDGEIARQRTLTWAGTPTQLGILAMLNSPTFRIWVNDDTSIGYDPVGAIGVPAYFSLTANTSLKAVAKGFTCQADTTNVRSGTMLSITYTVTWRVSPTRVHTRKGVAYFVQNGLHLSYQK